MPHPIFAHPVFVALSSVFLGAAGGAVGASVVSTTKKSDAGQPAALPSKVSGSETLSGSDEDQVSGSGDQTCDWRRVKNADLDPFVVGKYKGQLSTQVGTHMVFEHKGKWWLLETVSKDTDPDFTSRGKDVRGWIRIKRIPQKSAAMEASPATQAIEVVASDENVDDSSLSGSYKRMKIDNGQVVTSTDDLGNGEAENIGAIPVKIAQEGKFGIGLREVDDGKFGIPIKIGKSTPPTVPPSPVVSAPVASAPPSAPPSPAPPRASATASAAPPKTSAPPTKPPSAKGK